MGDDAELYWEMEHNPYFWDEVESCSRNNSCLIVIQDSIPAILDKCKS